MKRHGYMIVQLRVFHDVKRINPHILPEKTMRTNRFYHIFNKGDYVLFRDDKDYIAFNNKLAVAACGCRVRIIAFSIMSTHFHVLLEAVDEDAIREFVHRIKRSYAIYYGRRYGSVKGVLFITTEKPLEVQSLQNEINYVLKNPVHHYVSSSVFDYEYSSAAYLFMDEMIPPKEYACLMSGMTRVGNLGVRRKREIVGYDEVPGDWLVRDDGMVSPLSYLSIPRARAFWNGSVKQYLFDMIKSQTDARQELIDSDILSLRSSGFSDIDVCRIADGLVADMGKRSIHSLAADGLVQIKGILLGRGIQSEQVRRVLWLPK